MSWSAALEPAHLSATAAADLLASGQLSPVELVAAVIERARTTEPTVNAFAETCFDEAMAAAREAERRVRDPSLRRPLEGIPFAVKDVFDVAGQRTTHASLANRDAAPARRTDVVVQRILDAGGIQVGRTCLPEYSCAGFTHSRLWGVTRNPWNPDFSPGGSSGGSAAALAAGSATLALGTDVGGSIRVPASCCGVVGYKPPYGRVPHLPLRGLDHYDHTGPLARTVEDCALLLEVIQGPDPSDPASLPATPIGDWRGDLEGLRIAYSPDLGGYPVAAEVERNARAAASSLAAAGASVEEVVVGFDRTEIARAWWAHMVLIDWRLLGRQVAAHRSEMTPYAIAAAERGLPEGVEYIDTWAAEARAWAALHAVLAEHDALVCPTMPYPALEAGDDYLDRPLLIDGRDHGDRLATNMCMAFNLCSRCPVLAVPSGSSAHGIPTGVQVVGRPYDDATVLRVGAAIERCGPWAARAPHQAIASLSTTSARSARAEATPRPCASSE